MATYIQGQTDYISQIQPTEPNLAFDAQVLQTKQTKYDANHKKVSDLYGSLLNSAMTRTDNIQARDEFFKIINDDIRKMGGLDFSLDQNVQAASSVFQSIYTNNDIVKDMVWTKNFESETNRSEAFKSCIDPEKCGGQWWEEGDKYLQYKREEFKNASAGDAMGMADPKYVPYTNVTDLAMKKAKEAGLSVTRDSFSPDGKYIITTKNGESLQSPLTSLFNETIGKDPKVQDMYKVKSYTQRKDWISNKVGLGEYKDENEASVGYFRERNDAVQKTLDKQAVALNVDLGSLTEKYDELQSQYKAGKFKEGSDEYARMVNMPQLMQNAADAKGYTDLMIKANQNSNNPRGLSILGDYADDQNASDFYNNDINKAAETLAYKDSETKFKADDFALKQKDYEYDVSLEGIKQSNKMSLENWKLDHGIYNDKIDGSSSGSGGKNPTPDKVSAYTTKMNEAEEFGKNLKLSAFKLFKEEYPENRAAFSSWTRNSSDPKVREKYDKAMESATVKLTKLKTEANSKALSIGEPIKFTDVISSVNLEKSGVSEEFKINYLTRMYEHGQKFGLDPYTVDLYIDGKKGNSHEPIFYQLEKLGQDRAAYEAKKEKEKNK
jgi:hypothetical protein